MSKTRSACTSTFASCALLYCADLFRGPADLLLAFQVVYPALDAKVKNVTLAYSVEHEDEERLFDQLTVLLGAALRQDGKERYATLRQLECKIEEVHTTLRKHLSKEEEQLLPLLLQHFSFAEQVGQSMLSCVQMQHGASRGRTSVAMTASPLHSDNPSAGPIGGNRVFETASRQQSATATSMLRLTGIVCCLQAELVAQFLCCIPLSTIEVVLAWLRPIVPEAEQQELMRQVLHACCN